MEIIGLSPKYLFGLDSITDILPEEDRDTLLDQLDYLDNSNSSDVGIDRDNTSTADPEANIAPEVFLLNGRRESGETWCCWTAVHSSVANQPLITLELELRYDDTHPLILKSPSSRRAQQPSIGQEDGTEPIITEKAGMDGTGFDAFSEEDLLESTTSCSKPIRRVRRSVLRGDESGSMEIFSILSQINEQLSAAEDLAMFLKIVAGVIKDITSFHRVMVYQFDDQWNGQVVAELVDWNETKDLFQGLYFPATDIPAQARSLYVVNKVRVLYDRDQPTARLVCRSHADLAKPLDMTHSFLRAMSPVHLEYLANMGVRASMSISIIAFGRLWGLIACHTYGDTSMRCSFLVRKLCRLVGDQISHNIERLSYAARLTARKLVHTADSNNPAGYIVSKAEDLLGLFEADIGMLSVGDEGRILGPMQNSQEAIALREYFRARKFETITPSNDLRADFPDLDYEPGFKTIAGVMYIPLSRSGEDFLLFFRRGHLQKVHWAGNPYEKVVEKIAGKPSTLLPRQSFKVWSENVVGRCKEWSEDQVETAAVLCLVYGKFIEVWREKQQALQTSKLASLLLSNAGHEVRTPLNAVINYLEIALEGTLDDSTRENLLRSHTASKSLVYVINDLLDLTKSEQGQDLFRNEPFDLLSTIREAVSMYRSQASRAEVSFSLQEDADIPRRVLGDQAKIRQVVGNVTANALKYTEKGSVEVRTKLLSRTEESCEMAIIVQDTGCGISEGKMDAIFSNFELVEPASQQVPRNSDSSVGTGLGLAIVARIVGNMNGQLKAESKVGRGSTFTFVFHFVLPASDLRRHSDALSSHASSSSTQRTLAAGKPQNEIPTRRGSSASQSQLQAKRNNGSTRVSAKSPAESTNVGDFVWPSEEQHQLHKDEAVGSNRTTTGSRASVGEQLRDLHLASVQSSGGSDIDSLVLSLMAPSAKAPMRSESTADSVRSLPPSPSAHLAGSRRGTFGLLPADTTSSTTPPRDAVAIANSVDATNNASSRGSATKSHFSSMDDTGNSERQIPQLDEAQELDDPRTSVAHNHALQPVRAVKMDVSVVRVPQRHQQAKAHRLTSNSASAPRSRANGQDPPATAAVKVKILKILIAEDDPINRTILQKRFQLDKHELKLTNDGSDCYDEYAANPTIYDVILMDLQMPVLDGFGAARKIRQLEQSSNVATSSRIPILAVSASLLESQAQVAINAGIDGWILKPVNFQRLKQLFAGLKDDSVRAEDFYSADGTTVEWEAGGWLTTIQGGHQAAQNVQSSKNVSP